MASTTTAAVEFDLPFATPPDLRATMDIQIPALAWQPDSVGGYRRVLHLGGQPVTVTVREGGDGLHVTASRPHGDLPGLLRRMFPIQIGDLDLGNDRIWKRLQARYRGVIAMWAPPFEALVITVLSQNRTGEIVRRVYPALDQLCGGLTPQSLAALDRDVLRAAIRSSGPYKADRLSELAALVAADGLERFERRIMNGHPAEALAYLQALPGVAHKTAACVVVFSARTTTTLPVDVHLFRVADRLGLVSHGGVLTPNVRDSVISQLLSYGADVALARVLFLLVGRSTCTAGAPACTACFLRRDCRHAGFRRSTEGERP
ncbi:MAG: hypothetical protein FWJ70_03625 [Micromonosporaceae bacterium]